MNRKMLFAIAILAGTCACQPQQPIPTVPDINIVNENTNNNGGGSNSGTGSSGTCAVAALKGGIFGDQGGSACAGRTAGGLKVGCRVDFTVTPKTPSGVDATPTEHGSNLIVTESEGANLADLGEDSDNAFNFTITPKAAGSYALKATLNAPGCPAIERTYQFEIAG